MFKFDNEYDTEIYFRCTEANDAANNNGNTDLPKPKAQQTQK